MESAQRLAVTIKTEPEDPSSQADLSSSSTVVAVPCTLPLPHSGRGDGEESSKTPSGENRDTNIHSERPGVLRMHSGSDSLAGRNVGQSDSFSERNFGRSLEEQSSAKIYAGNEQNSGGEKNQGEKNFEQKSTKDQDMSTFRVIENSSSVVKFAPANGSGIRGEFNTDAESPKTCGQTLGHTVARTGTSADDSMYEGRTISLVEDVHNADTFKITDEEGMNVISDNRIMVFEHGDSGSTSAHTDKNNLSTPYGNAVEKINLSVSYGNSDGSLENEAEEPTSSFIRSSINTLNNDRCDDVTDDYATRGVDDVTNTDLNNLEGDTCEENYGMSGEREGGYNTRSGGAEGQGVQSIATTGIMRPLQHEGTFSGQSYGSGRGVGSSGYSATATAGTQNRAWNYQSAEREAPVSLQHHFTNDSTSAPGYTAVPGTTGGAPSTHGYPTSATSTTTHPATYPDAGSAYSGYLSQINAWPGAGAPGGMSHMDSMAAYTMSDAEKMGLGYGHPPHPGYAAAYSSGYLPPSASGGYLQGYGVERGSWHGAGKPSGDAGQIPAAISRDGMAYPHQQHKGGTSSMHPVSTPISHPFSFTSPAWDSAAQGASQGQTRFAVSGRGRGQIKNGNKPKPNTGPPNSESPVIGAAGGGGGNNTHTPLSLPGPDPVGRPRKRPASHDLAMIEKATNPPNKAISSNNAAMFATANKEQPSRKRSREAAFSSAPPALSAVSNVQTLKPGHIIAWYIDYLIHENEDRTQISRAFTLPVNLFHTDDFYFLDSLRKKVKFPSPKFLAWMQRHLPSLNAHAIDFWEGRPPGRESKNPHLEPPDHGPVWGGEWSWHNKTKRDIIHDVFFFFQHRKAAGGEPTQLMGRAKVAAMVS